MENIEKYISNALNSACICQSASDGASFFKIYVLYLTTYCDAFNIKHGSCLKQI